MPLTLSGNGTISDLASAPTVGGTALPTNLSDLGIANHDQITVDSSGRMTNSSQVAFAARSGGAYGGIQGNGIGKYGITNLNVGNHYNTSTYTFTAPISGNYYISAGLYTPGPDDLTAEFRINGSASGVYIQDRSDRTGANTYELKFIAALLPLSANDNVVFFIIDNAYLDSNTWFTGYLLG